MKNIKYLFLILAFQTLSAQNVVDNMKTVYENSITEKVYVHFNNVLYLPGETVHYKIYVAESDNKPSTLSDYVYVDLYDGVNKKIASQTYFVENGSAVGSYQISADMPSGLYKIRAYTRIQNQTVENIFEKTFFVQKVVSPRVLMTLDFKKKAYGKGEICEADFELKNLESQPIKNYNFKYDVFIAGKKIDSLQGKTDESGKAIISFKLPKDLKSNDGIVNVLIDYDNFQESVTRSIPISLNFVDLQFLPESGNFVLDQASSVFFIAKNEFGLPMDVAGFIEDESGNKIADFKSFHDGMGSVILKTTEGRKYFAVLTSPFQSQEKIELPKAKKNIFVINAEKKSGTVDLKIYSPLSIKAQVLVRNTSKLHKTIDLSLSQGWNTISIKTSEFPVGIQSFSLEVENRIVAERLVFLNYQEGLKIEIKTDKETYLPREKVKVSIVTKDKNNLPIASNLSVAVVDSKLLAYIDDKQHNILSWLLLGFELKGKIHEPRFYFDEKQKLENKEQAIDVLLNTHGWRKYNQDNFEKLRAEIEKNEPEKSNSIEGFVLNQKQKAVAVKVLLFTDKGKVYETKSNSSGYFKFNRVHFSELAYLAVEGKRTQKFTIKNSFTDQSEFLLMRDTLSSTNTIDFKFDGLKPERETETPASTIVNEVSLDADSSNLSEVVVTAYGISTRKSLTGAISVITREDITNSLAGRAAGIQVAWASGQPGSAEKIIIRGNRSIYGSRGSGEPLIVIDGIAYANNENASVFGNLSPASIQSITILKDASATSIYGSAGLYGVIIVTTKNRVHDGGILLGKRRNYTFQSLNKAGTKMLTEAEEFYIPKYTTTIVEEKTDFRNCIYWNSVVQTNNEGLANFEFYNSDDNTSFKIIAEGTSYKGDMGKSEATYSVKELIQTDVKIPLYASQEDEISVPLWIKNNSEKAIKLEYTVNIPNQLSTAQNQTSITINPNDSKTIYIPLKAITTGKNIPIEITLTADDFKTKIKKTIDINPKGFPVNIDIAGTKTQSKDFVIKDPLANSIESGFKLFYNPFSSIFDGLESMMREPYGCFEQVSSSNYPNIMAMQLLKYKDMSPEFKQKALDYLKSGYQKLKNYESKDGGFEWYGGNPGHEALTAYGLLQFNEMKEFINIDKKLVERSTDWLNSRKDGKGGFKQNAGRYGFSGIQQEVNNAYIVYVLSEIGRNDFKLEYEKALAEAFKNKDIYRMELMALASFNLKKIPAYKELMEIIKNKITKEGYKNIKAEQTVINSYGQSMSTEIASLYALSLLKENQITREVTDALDFIQSQKNSYGFGSTQATALALKAITEFTKISSVSNTNATVALNVNKQAVDLSQKDSSGNVILKKVDVKTGENNFSIAVSAENTVPYLFYVQYQTYLPNNSKECKMQLSTRLATNKAKISETVRLEVEAQNKDNKAVSNPIVRIGIPGGLTPEPWQLKELMDKNIIDYYEIFGNELVFYFRKFDAKETKKINVDLKAIVSGKYKGVASSAYLYYENEHKNWNSGLEIEVIP